jgi:hypothetical protein
MRRHSDTLRAGDPAPEFMLDDANGRAHSLRELLSERADLEGRPLQTQAHQLLLVFDRGTW